MADTTTKRARPLSPHVGHYRKLFTMMMSIMHRITGAALYFGTALLVIWLLAIADGPESYDRIMGLSGHPALKWVICLVLFGYTWALIHHMLGGIRHFIWDTGKGFNLGFVDLMAWGNAVLSVVLTVLVWLAGCYFGGGI